MKATTIYNKLAGMGTDGIGRGGFPKTDVERVMTHYKVTREEAQKMLQEGKVKLPLRGTGLRRG